MTFLALRALDFRRVMLGKGDERPWHAPVSFLLTLDMHIVAGYTQESAEWVDTTTRIAGRDA